MENLIGITAKGLKVLANRVAKKTDCKVIDNEGFIKSYNLIDKETGDFFINIPENGKITGMEKLSVNFNNSGYTIEETSEYFVSKNCFHSIDS